MIAKKLPLKQLFFFGLIFLAFIAIRFIHLPESIGFGSDEGRDFLAVWHMVTSKQLTLIGPPSEYAVNGRQFFFGSAPYYFILPALLIGHWDPLAVSYFLIIFNAVVFIVALIILNNYIKEKSTLYLFAVFYSFTPALVNYTRSYWNPYFMLPVSLLLVSHLLASKYVQRNVMILFGCIGFLFGLGLQFHYSFIFAILLGGVWLLVTKKLTIRTMLSLVAGFIIGFSPLILFELRNHFYNLTTFLLVFTSPKNAQNKFTWNIFYFISLVPFLLFFLSLGLGKLSKRYPFVIYSLLGIMIVWSVVTLLSAPTNVLNYPALRELSKAIQADQPLQFNIVDQMSRDNRAMALRYLLTVQGAIPMGVEEYPKAQTLYVYSQLPLNTVLKNPVWEISSAEPFSTVKILRLKNNLYLYALQK